MFIKYLNRLTLYSVCINPYYKLASFKLNLLIVVTFFCSSMNLLHADDKDIFISESEIGKGCITTIDLNITENLAQDSDLILDYNYGSIRSSGIIMNVFYSNALGRSQWTDFPSPTNIYLMPSSILVPINRWIKNGMKTNGTWWVRIVLLRGGNC